jgi:hypothetical protein
MKRIIDSDYKANMRKMLKIDEDDSNKKDLVFKHKVVNIKENINIKPCDSYHSKSL